MSSLLITIEGIECSGKGAQTRRLLTYFQTLNQPAILLREPGGTVYGEALRALLKHPQLAITGINQALAGHEDFPEPIDVSGDFSRSPYCELLMFVANRVEFIDKKVQPALAAGKTVITDRLHYSTRAYQGGGRFHHHSKMIAKINWLNDIAMQGIKPNIVFLLDITVEEMLRRQQQNKDKDAFFEKTCNRDFFERTRTEYLNIAQEEPNRFVVIDGTRSIDDIHEEIIELVKHKFSTPKEIDT